MGVRNVKHSISAYRVSTYQIDNISGRRKFMQNRYGFCEWLQDFVLSAEFTEGLGLFTKNVGNRLNRTTILQLLREWMLGQDYARLLFVVSQGSLEENL
jgi:hypothetical protein